MSIPRERLDAVEDLARSVMRQAVRMNDPFAEDWKAVCAEISRIVDGRPRTSNQSFGEVAG